MKKFITIALAVAVLFSFAACQPTYKTVIGMSATTDKTNYLVGQSIDLSSVDVTVRYSDGSSDTFTGEDVTYMGPAKFTLTDAAAASTTVTFAYGSMNISDSSTITPVATLVLSIHTPKTVELSNLPTTGTVGDTAADIDFSEVAATVTDAAGNTYEVPANALVLTPTVTNEEGEQEVTACTATVYGMSAEVKGIDDWKVTLAKEASTHGDAKTITVKLAQKDSKDVTVYYGDTVSDVIVVEAADAESNTWILDSSEYTLQTTKGNISTFNSLGKVTVYAYLNADPSISDATGKEVTVNNFIEAVVAQGGASQESTTNLYSLGNNTAISTIASQVVLYGRYAVNPDTSSADNQFISLSETTKYPRSYNKVIILEGTAKTDTFTVTVTNEKGDKLSPFTVNVTTEAKPQG